MITPCMYSGYHVHDKHTMLDTLQQPTITKLLLQRLQEKVETAWTVAPHMHPLISDLRIRHFRSNQIGGYDSNSNLESNQGVVVYVFIHSLYLIK